MVTLDLIGLATYTFIEGRKGNLAATLVIYSEEPLHERGVSHMHAQSVYHVKNDIVNL